MATASNHALETTSSQVSRTRNVVARHLLPFLFILYIANYLDRANLAYAALGMTTSLSLAGNVFGTAAGIFFVSYVALQIPGALLSERWSARKLIAFTMIVWGSLTVLTAAVSNAPQLYGARFLLGAAESGFFPAVIVYLSHWFPYEDRAKATANFMAAIPVSFIIGSPLAGLLLGVRWFNLEGWRWLFILEGMPAVVLGILTFFYLNDRPDDAHWLSLEQKAWLDEKLAQEKRQKSHVQSITIGQALRYPPVLILASALFFAYMAFYSFIFWFPTMLKKISGLSDLNVGLLGAIPYIAGFIGMQVVGWSSDRTRERKLHFTATQILGALALISAVTWANSVAAWVILFALVGVSICSMLPCFWALPGAFLTDSAAAASIGFINAAGSVAGFVAPIIMGYLHERTGSFNAGLVYMIASFFVASILVLFCPREQLSTAS